MNRAVLLRLLGRALDELAHIKSRHPIAPRRERVRALIIAVLELLRKPPADGPT